MVNIKQIEELIEPCLKSEGFEIVRVSIQGSGSRPTLEILIDKSDDTGVSVRDCTRANHLISAILDVEDVIHKAYFLEVSSAGLERPLIKLSDFQRFQGKKAKIELKEALSGRKRLKGVLKGVEGENILFQSTDVLNEEEQIFSIPHEDIHKANLIFDMFLEKVGEN